MVARLDDKITIVTGGASGMGAASASVFADEGAEVYIADIQDEAGETLAASLGDRVHYRHLDVTDKGAWVSLADEIIDAHGRIDALFNNAGMIKFCGLFELSPEDIQHILDVNLKGVIFGTQVIGEHMVRAGAGSIINNSSADGISAANALAAYVSSKWAVRGFTKAAALELGPLGVRVNSIHPGGIDTPLANRNAVPRELFDMGFKPYPAQRAGDPKEIAWAALFLASDESSYCMGTELTVDGGLTAGHYYMNLPGAPKTD